MELTEYFGSIPLFIDCRVAIVCVCADKTQIMLIIEFFRTVVNLFRLKEDKSDIFALCALRRYESTLFQLKNLFNRVCEMPLCKNRRIVQLVCF